MPQVASPIARGRCSTIIASTQATPPQPRGLSWAKLTSAASRGKSMVIASWASWRIRSSSPAASVSGRRPTTTPAATAAGRPDSGSSSSQPVNIRNRLPRVSCSRRALACWAGMRRRASANSQPEAAPIATPPPSRTSNPVASPRQPCRSPRVSSSSNRASTAPIGSSTSPSPSSTSPRGGVRRIWRTSGFTTVGPVASTMALNTAARTQLRPASQWASTRPPSRASTRRTAQMRSTAWRVPSAGRRRLSPPSNSTRLTSRPVIVPRPLPRSSGSTRPRPARPISSPALSSSTTPGRPVSQARAWASAPANTVTPQSSPSRSGVIHRRGR